MAQLQKEKDNITYCYSKEPYKCGNQIFNIGLSKAKTPYVATVMNSIRVEPEWELQAIQLLNQMPEIGIVGFKCLFPDGKIESAGLAMGESQVVDWGRFANVATHVPVDMGRDLPGHRCSLTYECAGCQWAFCMLRKEAIGKLEEDVYYGFKGWDDIDNCFVVRKKGWKVYYCGSGVAYHTPRATRGDDSEVAMRQNAHNAEQFFRRWGFWKGDNEGTTGTADTKLS
jgi:GT2 family glycosyltransferase